jgi:hypothetical protein
MLRKGFPFTGRRIFLALLLPLAAGAVFFSRGPVLLVADGPFADLYGAERLKVSLWLSALRLFRPVRLVMLSDAIGSDGIALAAADRAEKPYAAVFPGRYREGAELYARRRPRAHTIVLLEPGEGTGGEQASPGGDSPEAQAVRCFTRDLKTDLYRAGFAARELARGRDGVLVCVTGPGMGETEKAAFKEGAGSQAALRYISPEEELPPEDFIAAAVFFGHSERFFEEDASYPAVLFTWMDRILAPDNVAVIFDDSLPALAVSAVRRAVSGGGELPAAPRVIKNNPGKALKGIARKKAPLER